MKTDRIKVSIEYTYHGLSRWVGMEASLDETDNGKEKECLKQLETTAREFISESVKEQKEVPVVQEPKDNKLTGMAHYEYEINKCTTIPKPDGIEQWRTIADMNPKIKEIFDKRLKELQNDN